MSDNGTQSAAIAPARTRTVSVRSKALSWSWPARQRQVGSQTPADDLARRVVGGRKKDEPVAGGPKDSKIGLAVAIVIARHWQIGAATPGDHDARRVVGAGLQDVP